MFVYVEQIIFWYICTDDIHILYKTRILTVYLSSFLLIKYLSFETSSGVMCQSNIMIYILYTFLYIHYISISISLSLFHIICMENGNIMIIINVWLCKYNNHKVILFFQACKHLSLYLFAKFFVGGKFYIIKYYYYKVTLS